jgi:polyribonucleotide 5'-hydroxyl-kinase
VFGAELSLGRKVPVRAQALAIFTWHGCRLLVEGEPEFV